MAATWNREILFEVGNALGREARAKGCGMLLGPMVILHRIPAGGRNYETFSEDPKLTARLAAALARGLQAEGTGACIKSFLCNNQQTAQKNTSAEVDDTTLRQLYLRVFELILKEVTPWAIMTSYNPVNGEYPSDSIHLLKNVLRAELGFDGVIVSDWSAVESGDAIHSTLDIEMPGPPKYLTPERFRSALADGSLTLDEIDRRVSRILDLHLQARAAADGSPEISAPELNSPRHARLARKVAEESMVLLKNDGGVLPLDPAGLGVVALIGPNAANARIGGGGSASVLPPYVISPLQGLTDYAAGQFKILYAEGCSLSGDSAAIPPGSFTTTLDGTAPGLRGDYFEIEEFHCGGNPGTTTTDPQVDFSWGWAAPRENVPRVHFAARWQGFLQRPSKEPVTLGLSTNEGVARLWIRDQLILDCWSDFDAGNFEERFQNRNATAEFDFGEDDRVPIRIEFEKTGAQAGIRLSWILPDAPDTIASAAELAAKADCAIVVVGLSNMHEGGGHDRESFSLPGRQDELIRRIAEVNPKTIVVLKNGTPVCMRNWRARVPTILESFYPGQEGGAALARVLFGEANPGGRLPFTYPRSWGEVAAMEDFPGEDGKVHYREGRMVGYRHYDTADLEPEFPFGYGLSYTEFKWSPPLIDRIGNDAGELVVFRIRCEVANVGAVAGAEVLQLYLERLKPKDGEPVRELIDFEKIHLAPGTKAMVEFEPRVQQESAADLRFALGPHSRDLIPIDLPGV